MIELENVLTRFATSACSWLSTVRPDGRAHAAPIWHIWCNGRAYVVTTAEAVKVHNIELNPHVVITHPDPHHAIIIEGMAAVVSGMDLLLQPHFKKKYDWDIVTDEKYSTVIEIKPTRLIAWGEEGAGTRKRWGSGEISKAAQGCAKPGSR